MLFGMGTVFVFLTVLVFATTVMSKLVNRFAPEVEAPVASGQANSSTTDTHAVSTQIISAIQQAVALHRKNSATSKR
jgi:oxaloacetate decarboxylase gamma subunit